MMAATNGSQKMTKDKEEALKVQIMILSALKWIENPTPKVNKLTLSMFKAISKEYSKHTGKYRIERVGKYIVRTPIRKASDEYTRINDEVIENWRIARSELIPKDSQLYSSMSEIIQVLWDRIADNPYQERYCSDKRIQGVINAIDTAGSKIEFSEVEGDNNSRKLANRFLELCNVKPRHNLATRKHILRENLIISGKEVVL